MNFTRLNPKLPAWSESKVWVIGASSGIGAAVAEDLLRAGKHVFMEKPMAVSVKRA